MHSPYPPDLAITLTDVLVKQGVKGQQRQQIALNCCNGLHLSVLTVVLALAQRSAQGRQQFGGVQARTTRPPAWHAVQAILIIILGYGRYEVGLRVIRVPRRPSEWIEMPAFPYQTDKNNVRASGNDE
jgi:hypothetical protein